MWWLRLWTHSKKAPPPHQFQTYERWLTTFICCGCAYGCGLTMLLPLSLAKLLRWCYCKSRVILDTKPQRYAVVEALDSFIMTLNSVSNICKVFDKTFICCGCTYSWCILITFLPLSFATLLKFYQESWMHVLFKKTLCYVVIEALDPFFMAITSILFIYKVFHNLHMLWMYIGMCSYHVTTSLINQAHRILLRILDNAGKQTTALCSG